MAQVLLFGWFAETAGWRSKDMAVSSLSELRGIIAADHPAIEAGLGGKTMHTAVNQTIVMGDVALSPHDEVALFPAVSGGRG